MTFVFWWSVRTPCPAMDSSALPALSTCGCGAHPRQAARVYDALIAFGAPADHFDKADFTIVGRVLQLGVAPQRIDVLTGISGVRFDEAWEAREIGRLDVLEVPILSRAHLITNKRATGL